MVRATHGKSLQRWLSHSSSLYPGVGFSDPHEIPSLPGRTCWVIAGILPLGVVVLITAKGLEGDT